MPTARQMTAIIEREGDGFVALCPELDIASQGESIEDLFFEAASPSEVSRRFQNEVFVTQVEVPVG